MILAGTRDRCHLRVAPTIEAARQGDAIEYTHRTVIFRDDRLVRLRVEHNLVAAISRHSDVARTTIVQHILTKASTLTNLHSPVVIGRTTELEAVRHEIASPNDFARTRHLVVRVVWIQIERHAAHRNR